MSFRTVQRAKDCRHPSRRAVLIGGGASLLAGCAGTTSIRPAPETASPPVPAPHIVTMYRAVPEERFPIPAVDVARIDPRYLRQQVAYNSAETIGTIVVDPNAKFLYLIQEGNQALRYGVGVGRVGFGWSGRALINMKREWPIWTPPASMIEREPQYAQYAGGMEPGLDNPLGARALYLFEGGRDTLYRLHGTREQWSIGQAVSSGCIRLFNQDIIDLYERTPLGTTVVVLPSTVEPAVDVSAA